MARYIDLEELEKRINENIKPDTPEEKDLIEWCKDECIRQAYAMPTADVAPRAEVDKARLRGYEQGKRDNVYGFSAKELAEKIERLSVELEAMRGAANSYKMHYEKAKIEVAREIFEEIDREINDALQSNYKVLPIIEESEALWNRVNGKIDALRGIDGFIDELKQKYTEDKKDEYH